MYDRQKVLGRKWHGLRHFPGICPEKLRKSKKKTGQKIQCHSQDLNQELPDYKSSGLLLELTCSVCCLLQKQLFKRDLKAQNENLVCLFRKQMCKVTNF